MAELYKRDASPYWYCTIEDPRAPEGRQRRSTKCRSRKEAAAVAAAFEEQVRQEVAKEQAESGLTFTKAMLLYMERATFRSVGTKVAKGVHAGIIAKSCLGDFDLGSLTHADIKRFIAERRASFVPKRAGGFTDRHVSDQTIRNYLSTISSLYQWLIDNDIEGAPEVNPFANFNRRALGRSQRVERHFRPNQFQVLMERLKKREHRRIVVALCYTGMRSGELCQLRWDEVDFDQKVIEFGNGDPTRTKRHRARRIAMNQLCASTLLAQREELKERKLYQKEGLVFPSSRSDRPRPNLNGLRNAVKAAWPEIGYTNHRLRHTFATWCLNGGLDPLVIRDLLGHTTLSTTTIYAHLISNAAADRFRSTDLPGLAQNLAQSIGLEDDEAA